MRWTACELHTHTFHSDGQQTLLELAKGAAMLGFECIALTDHNTMTGLEDRERVESETGITVIPGMEWTTFYGHMVTIGLQEYVDWRAAGPQDIHEGIRKVHVAGGLAGMAHPFRIGSPICTGCYWEFEIRDWNDIDYMEVWSGVFPQIQRNNQRAFQYWTDRLNEGCRLTATAGRDWHRQEKSNGPISVTYLGLDGEGTVPEQVIKALRRGCVSVTTGPLLQLELVGEKDRFMIGDEYSVQASPGLARVTSSADGEKKLDSCEARTTVDFSVRSGQWALPRQSFELRIVGSTGELARREMNSGSHPSSPAVVEVSTTLKLNGLTWMRAELWGMLEGVRAMLAFTNPIYFK